MPPRIGQPVGAGPLSIAIIQRVVAEHFGISMNDLLSKRLFRGVARPRQVGYYLCRELTPCSLPQIGKAFHRDHSTIVHGILVIERELRRNPGFAAVVAALKEAARVELVDVGDRADGSSGRVDEP